VCARGASALESVLAQNPKARLRVWVVWEPELASDLFPPTTAKLGLIRDSRVEQFWDRGHAVSAAMGGPAAFRNPTACNEIEFSMGQSIWDFVAIYPPGTQWDATLPKPLFDGGPVVESTDELNAVLNGFGPKDCATVTQ
jgi:hypothetical protein